MRKVPALPCGSVPHYAEDAVLSDWEQVLSRLGKRRLPVQGKGRSSPEMIPLSNLR